MAVSAKALALANDLVDKLKWRFVFVGPLAFDSDGGPFFKVSNEVDSSVATGKQAALVKVKQIDPLGVDVIGNAAKGYAQSVAQVVLELSATAGLDFLKASNQLALLGEIVHHDIRVELYERATGTAVAVGDIVGTNLVTTFDEDLQYKTMKSQ